MPLGMRVCAVAFLCALPAGGAAVQQQPAPAAARDAAETFVSDAGAEAKRGAYLFYTQDYRDKHKRRVVLHGSVYGVLRDVGVKGCDVAAIVEVDDLFSGTIGDVPTGNVQDKTEYDVRFRLTPEIASGIDVMQGRPTQLGRAMHTECEQDAACSFAWLRIRSPQSTLQERIVVNNSITFEGPVSQILAPVSSPQAGNWLVRDLQALAAAQCNRESSNPR